MVVWYDKKTKQNVLAHTQSTGILLLKSDSKEAKGAVAKALKDAGMEDGSDRENQLQKQVQAAREKLKKLKKS